MAQIFSGDAQGTSVSITLANGVEQIVSQGTAANSPSTNCKVAIFAVFAYDAGPAATSIVFKLRLGNSLTGTVIATTTLGIGAPEQTGGTGSISGVTVLSNAVSIQTCLTATVVGDNGHVQNCMLSSTVLSG